MELLWRLWESVPGDTSYEFEKSGGGGCRTKKLVGKVQFWFFFFCCWKIATKELRLTNAFLRLQTCCYRIISTRRWHMLCAISWLFHFRDVPPPPHALYIPLFAIKHHATHHWPNAAQPQTLNLYLLYFFIFAFFCWLASELKLHFPSILFIIIIIKRKIRAH